MQTGLGQYYSGALYHLTNDDSPSWHNSWLELWPYCSSEQAQILALELVLCI
jgi:hypothetical protein